MSNQRIRSDPLRQAMERALDEPTCPVGFQGNLETSREDAILIREHAMTSNHWITIAGRIPGRSAVQVKNRWNWLARHKVEITQDALIPMKSSNVSDVVERKGSQAVFEPLEFDGGLFGARFQEFQAKMFLN
jgi:hypothetical protein